MEADIVSEGRLRPEPDLSAEADRRDDAARTGAAEGGGACAGPFTILVVEGDEARRRAWTEALAAPDVRIAHAASGAEALHAIGIGQPDAVLLGVKLPDAGGFDLCRQIRARSDAASLPVFLISAEAAGRREGLRVLDNDADTYVTAGQHPETLAMAIRACARAHRAEAARRRSDARFRSVFELAAVGMAQVARDGRIVAANRTLCELLGYPEKELAGRDFCDFAHTGGLEKVRHAFAALWEAPAGSLAMDWQCVRRDGTGVRAHLRASLMPEVPGTERLAVVSVSGNPGAVRPGPEPRTGEERLQKLAESNIIGIVTGDAKRVKSANDAYLAMIGRTRADLEAGPIDWTRVTPAEHLANDYRALEELRTKGWCTPFEKEYVHPDGKRVPVLLGAAALRRDPLEWICFAVDLTERKAFEKRLLESQKLESIGLLAGGIAHDFNNLLVGVVGHASLVQEMLPAESPAQPFLQGIQAAGERAAHLIRQMLAYSGRGGILPAPVDLSRAVAGTVDLLRPSLPGTIPLHLDLEPDPPLMEADPGQVRQMIVNLVLNAVEAVGDSPGSITLRTGHRRLGSPDQRPPELAELPSRLYATLEVRDTGCGMDAGTMARIFEPFFTTKFTGRGLGLAAVSGIVRAHGGAIHVSSHPGQGAAFLVLLPCREADGRG